MESKNIGFPYNLATALDCAIRDFEVEKDTKKYGYKVKDNIYYNYMSNEYWESYSIAVFSMSLTREWQRSSRITLKRWTIMLTVIPMAVSMRAWRMCGSICATLMVRLPLFMSANSCMKAMIVPRKPNSGANCPMAAMIRLKR